MWWSDRYLKSFPSAIIKLESIDRNEQMRSITELIGDEDDDVDDEQNEPDAHHEQTDQYQCPLVIPDSTVRYRYRNQVLKKKSEIKFSEQCLE